MIETLSHPIPTPSKDAVLRAERVDEGVNR